MVQPGWLFKFRGKEERGLGSGGDWLAGWAYSRKAAVLSVATVSLLL